MTSPVGLISGRYRLGELLGTGGSASVFAALDTNTGERIALKVLHPHFSERAALREAFFAEARRAQGLRHPNVVSVFGTGVHEASGVTVAWIALERAEGVSLAEHVSRRGALTVNGAVSVAEGVLLALEAAHDVGLIHRDVSPANVMLTADQAGDVDVRNVRLLDFGLADAAGRAALGADILRSDESTRPAGVVGNVDFMSPEQIRGEAVDERGDVYQAGGVLHFALTGRAPFARETPAETLRSHLEAPPPVPSVMDSRIPRDLDRIVVRALLKDPADRYADAVEMRRALESAAVERRGADGEVSVQSVNPDLTATRVMGRTSVPARSAAVETRTAVQPRAAASLRSPSGRRPEYRAGRRSRVGAWASAIAALAAAATILTFATINAPVTAVAPPPTTAPPSTPDAVQPTASAEPGVEFATVPELGLMRLSEARLALGEAGLTPGTLAIVDSGHPGDTVLGSSPEAGARIEAGSVVNLTVASGFNLVPDVAGMSRANALAFAESAGFTVDVSSVRTSASPAGIVVDILPEAGTVLRLGATVTIVEAEPAQPTPSPTATPTPVPTPTVPPPPRGGDE